MLLGFYSRAAFILVAASVLHLAGECMQAAQQRFAGSLVLEFSFVLFALGFAFLPAALSTPTRVIGQAASLCAFVAAIAGAAMQVHFAQRQSSRLPPIAKPLPPSRAPPRSTFPPLSRESSSRSVSWVWLSLSSCRSVQLPRSASRSPSAPSSFPLATQQT